MNAAELADRLGARSAGEGSWSAKCPAHEDRNPSLSIGTGDNGGVVVHCHAGCPTEAVVTAAGVSMGDLAPAKATNDDAPIATYRYTDEQGTLLYEVVRRSGKRFHQRPANGRTGPGAMKDVPLVLYRLPAVVEAVRDGITVFVVEGEKDADNLVAAGRCATTAPMGADKWSKVRDHARQVLAGADVIVVRDNDEPGRRHANEVVASLKDVAATVLLSEPKTGKDVSDHLAAGLTVEELLEVDDLAPPRDAPPDPEPGAETTAPPLTPLDWTQAFNREPIEALLDGLLFPGRWTALVAPAKTGKSTLALHIAHNLSRGREPFTGTPGDPVGVLYLDGEMGVVDVLERIEALGLGPADLDHLHYIDQPGKGDTVQGGAAIVSTAMHLNVALVVFDGMNSFVSGAEKDDVPWRNLYDNTIAPLKRAGCSVLSTDNTGKDPTLSARGSSVKLDKADAIIEVKRKETGVTLKTTHTRSTHYLREVNLAMIGADGSVAITYRETDHQWPAGTREVADLLDTLAVPASYGRDKARAVLVGAGWSGRNDVLTAALKWRKNSGDRSGDRSRGQFSGTGL